MPTHVLLGAIAGLTIFLGLPVARWGKVSEPFRGVLTLLSAGVLLFLIIEVGYQAIELVEVTAKSGSIGAATTLGTVFVIGLAIGLIGLALVEAAQSQKSRKKESSKSKKGQPASLISTANSLEIATMIAIGIGLHNFAEGLAIGQSFSSGAMGFGMVLVVGFALHNATEGFGIAAPLAGQSVRWSRLFYLGLIAGAPTALGAWLGGIWVNPTVELLFLSMALGSLIYVIRELFRLRFANFSTVSAMIALMIGLLAGFATEMVVEVAQASSAKEAAEANAANTIPLRFMQGHQVLPKQVTVKQGQTLMIENQDKQSLVFEGNGLFVGEIVVSSMDQVPVTVTGNTGQYRLIDERNLSGTITVMVQAGGKQLALADEINAVGALTVLEGHVRASKALHDRALSGQSPDAALDLKRAGKHAGHPQHELLMGQEPDALALQRLLKQHGQLEALNQTLDTYVKLSGDKAAPTVEFEKRYQTVLSRVEQARRAIAGKAYDTADFRKKAAQFVLQTAASEYTTATEGGRVKVDVPGVPGKDNFFEYQDARGFLQATHDLLFPDETSDGFATRVVHRKLDQILASTFKPVDPVNPNQPQPVEEVKKAISDIEDNLFHSVQIAF